MYFVLIHFVLLVLASDLQILAQKSDRFNFFDIELLQSVTEATAGNVILSPASVKVALTTMVEGTGGRTRTEILSALRLPADVQVLRTTANQAIAPFKISRTGVELDLATRLWTGSNVVVNPHYVDVLRQYYGGESQSVNFGDAAKSSKTINDWVRQKTRGHIQSLVDPGSLEPGTKLLLTNALYLKGNWMHAFDRSLTKVQCFHTTNNDCQYSYLMENVGYYGYGYVPSLDADVVDIPYADGKLSMIILLPDRVEGGIMGLSRDFAHTPLSTIIASLRKTEVLVTLPRFTIESKLDLKHSLEKLGIRDLFDINANVSGIVSGPFQVGSVLHNAKIEVNEEGTIASAVTGIAVVPLMGSTVQRFRADHPFIFILRDSQTGSVLFAGRVTKPDVAPHPQPNYTEVFGKPPSDTNTRLRFAK